MVLSVNLAENLERIDEGIRRFNEEITDLHGKIEDKQNEIRRLEGCRIAYEGIKDAIGDICYSSEYNKNVNHEEHVKHEEHGHEHEHEHEHHHSTQSPIPETSKAEVTFSENMSLEDLYKKYRVM